MEFSRSPFLLRTCFASIVSTRTFSLISFGACLFAFARVACLQARGFPLVLFEDAYAPSDPLTLGKVGTPF
ncbi:hypothetical protein DLM78_00165 [Leptospira stimsonii]|uniref:Uncharacterized protein n=1 Tax=Leptospira stimsonii TaxID=2202203 RepID=A0A8B6RYX2_9LEPT|nr:hypothetical protein DLM78_00165 [Leptospira stimsonii]